MLDAADRSGRREGLEGQVDGAVADRVQGDLQATRVRPRQQLGHLVEVVVLPPSGEVPAVGVGVRVAAARRPGVEGAVGDQLERAHHQQVAVVGQRVTGADARGEQVVERVRVDRRPHPDQVEPGREPAGPLAVARRHLQVDHARDPARSGVGHRRPQRCLPRAAYLDLLQQRADRRLETEPVVLLQWPGDAADSQQPERGAVEPAVVGVAAGEHHGDVAGGRVQLGDGPEPVPRAGPVPEPADQARVLGSPVPRGGRPHDASRRPAPSSRPGRRWPASGTTW